MPFPSVIGVSAKIGCGKTFFSEAFIKLVPKYISLGFGDLLKKEASDRYDFPLEFCYNYEDKTNQLISRLGLPKSLMTVREVLQWYGTDFKRKEDPLYWVKAMEDTLSEKPFVIIDDVRFLNEAEMCLKYGILIRINPYPEWKPDLFGGHISECVLDNFKAWRYIINPGFGELQSYALTLKILIETGYFR